MIRPRARLDPRLVVALVVGVVVVAVAQVGLVLEVRAVLDRRQQVSDLRLDAAMPTFRPAPHAGLATPLPADAFASVRNAQTSPSGCSPLTALATTPVLDGRSWTGAGDRSLVPVTVLTARFVDAAAARTELDRKRWAMLRCRTVQVTFPPFDAPATTYTVSGQHWARSAVGRSATWTLEGGGRRFDFYVVRYQNTLSWTYDDDVSSPQTREAVADDLVERLRALAHE